MKALKNSKKNPFVLPVIAFFLGIILVIAIQKVFAGNTITYYACVKSNNGNIRMVSANTACGTGETLISWPQQGPQGPQGPAGNSAMSCSGCNFENSVIGPGDKFSGKDFSNEFLTANTFPEGTNFSNTSFVNSDLGRFRCGGNCNFSNVNFTNADLEESFLTGVGPTFSGNFTNANFTNANLKGGTFTGGDFTGAIWSKTICPNGSHSDTNGTSPESCLGNF